MCIENLKNKKLLILAGAGVHCKVVRAAKELGIYTIVTDYLEDSPAKAIADESWMYSVTDVDKIVQRCKDEKIDGVLNFCIDPAQIPYQQICEKLGVPCFGTKEQFDILTDKRKFKDYCLKYDVDVIPEYSKIDIEKGHVPLEIMAYGNLPIMKMNYCLLGKSNKCYPTCQMRCQTSNKYYLSDRLRI